LAGKAHRRRFAVQPAEDDANADLLERIWPAAEGLFAERFVLAAALRSYRSRLAEAVAIQ
jgi:hypothetical protein